MRTTDVGRRAHLQRGPDLRRFLRLTRPAALLRSQAAQPTKKAVPPACTCRERVQSSKMARSKHRPPPATSRRTPRLTATFGQVDEEDCHWRQLREPSRPAMLNTLTGTIDNFQLSGEDAEQQTWSVNLDGDIDTENAGTASRHCQWWWRCRHVQRHLPWSECGCGQRSHSAPHRGRRVQRQLRQRHRGRRLRRAEAIVHASSFRISSMRP